jgi:hypothetical protein
MTTGRKTIRFKARKVWARIGKKTNKTMCKQNNPKVLSSVYKTIVVIMNVLFIWCRKLGVINANNYE